VLHIKARSETNGISPSVTHLHLLFLLASIQERIIKAQGVILGHAIEFKITSFR